MGRSRNERLHVAYPVLLAFVTLLLFWGSLSAEFVYDDYPVVVDRASVQQEEFFGTGKWRPVRHASLVVDHMLFGDDPTGYHAHSLLWHLVCVLLVYAAARRIFANPALGFLTALLFAVHPIHVEAVTGVANRKEPLCLAFALMAFLGYARFLDGAGWRRWLWAVASGVAWIVSLLSKEVSIVLPVCLVLYEALCVPRERRFLLRYPSLAVAGALVGAALLVYLVVRFAMDPEVLRSSRTLKGYSGELSAPAVIMTSARAFFRYAEMLVWPSGLCPDHIVPLSTSFLEPRTALSWLGLGGLVVGSILLARRVPAAGFGALWLLVFYLPVSNLVPIAYIVADRYMYLPSFGFALLLVGLGARLHARLHGAEPRLAAAVLGVGGAAVIGGYALVAHSYNAAWLNEEALWAYTAQCEPRSYKADNAFGIRSVERGDLEQGLAHYARAIEKGSPNAWFNRGTALASVGRHEEALRDFDRAAELYPRRPRVHFARGLSLTELGRFEDAASSFAQVIRLNPEDAEAHNNRGAAFVRLGRLERALEEYEKAVALDPGHAAAHYNLAGVQLARGDRDAARRTYAIASRLGLSQADRALELLHEH